MSFLQAQPKICNPSFLLACAGLKTSVQASTTVRELGCCRQSSAAVFNSPRLLAFNFQLNHGLWLACACPCPRASSTTQRRRCQEAPLLLVAMASQSSDQQDSSSILALQRSCWSRTLSRHNQNRWTQLFKKTASPTIHCLLWPGKPRHVQCVDNLMGTAQIFTVLVMHLQSGFDDSNCKPHHPLLGQQVPLCRCETVARAQFAGAQTSVISPVT